MLHKIILFLHAGTEIEFKLAEISMDARISTCIEREDDQERMHLQILVIKAESISVRFRFRL